MTYKVKYGDITLTDPLDYEAIYSVSIYIDGIPLGLLIGKQKTKEGDEMLIGMDCLQFLDQNIDFDEAIKKAIRKADNM